MRPGSGNLEFGLYGDFKSKHVGGKLGYEHRWDEHWAAFADARGGYDFDAYAPYGEFMLGVRGKW